MKGKFLTETTEVMQDKISSDNSVASSHILYHAYRDGDIRFSNSPSLPLGLQKSQDVINLDGSLDVSDNGSRAVVHELDSDLSDTSSGTGTTEDL